MPHDFKAIVTGHSRGLGAALAEELLARGIPVFGLARQQNVALAERFPNLLSEARCDLGDAAALTAWSESESFRKFCADTTTLALINNAGTLGPVGPAETQPLEDIATAVALNVATPLMLSRAVARRHAGELKILHISSGAARSAYAGWSIYCATKAALDQHARAAAADGRTNLHICSLAPGVIDTDMQVDVRNTPEARFPMRPKFQKLKQEGHLTPPGEAARQIVGHLLSPAFGLVTTADIRDLAKA